MTPKQTSSSSSAASWTFLLAVLMFDSAMSSYFPCSLTSMDTSFMILYTSCTSCWISVSTVDIMYLYPQSLGFSLGLACGSAPPRGWWTRSPGFRMHRAHRRRSRWSPASSGLAAELSSFGSSTWPRRSPFIAAHLCWCNLTTYTQHGIASRSQLTAAPWPPWSARASPGIAGKAITKIM